MLMIAFYLSWYFGENKPSYSVLSHWNNNSSVLKTEWNTALWKENISMNIPFNSLTFCMVLGDVNMQIIFFPMVKK